MGMSVRDLAGMSLQSFGELVEAWNQLQGGDKGASRLSDDEANELSAMLDGEG